VSIRHWHKRDAAVSVNTSLIQTWRSATDTLFLRRYVSWWPSLEFLEEVTRPNTLYLLTWNSKNLKAGYRQFSWQQRLRQCSDTFENVCWSLNLGESKFLCNRQVKDFRNECLRPSLCHPYGNMSGLPLSAMRNLFQYYMLIRVIAGRIRLWRGSVPPIQNF
jgi:hypothetical protein